MDFFSQFMSVKDEYVLTGVWYARKPVTTADEGEQIQYSVVDPKRKSYGEVITNVMTDEGIYTIRTNDNFPYKPKQYIVTQDGRVWQITEVTSKIENERTKEALRLFRETAETEFTLRLTEVVDWQELGFVI